jgi:transposase
MQSMEAYPRAAMERAMKVQDVMLQAMAKRITWWQAAEILGISDRHMRRWRERYVEEGYNGLLDQYRRLRTKLGAPNSKSTYFKRRRPNSASRSQ